MAFGLCSSLIFLILSYSLYSIVNSFPEKSWSYKCVNEKCVREHYLNEHKSHGEKRVPYMSCAMTCGVPNIWPLPTIKTTLGYHSLTFRSHAVNLDITTKFDEARNVLQQAFGIFQSDLRGYEHNKASADGPIEESSARNEQEENTSKKSDKDCDIRHIDIKIDISTIKDVYLHIDMDESYELKITSKRIHYYAIIVSRILIENIYIIQC